jgi:hypothetical protein
VAIYADCLECEDKLCKNPIFIDYIQKVKTIQQKSKIWQILRNRRDIYSLENNDNLLLNGGMSCDAFDCPYSYTCNVFGYEMCFYSRTKIIEVYKMKWSANNNSVNLHYYYFISDKAPNLFADECIERITQEKLASIANRNWAEYKNFVKTKANKLFLKQMKIKYIKCLEYHKQIIYDEKEKKYKPYDFYMFCKNRGWEK